MADLCVLNTGARIPSIGLGTAKTEPGTIGEAVYTAVKIGLALKKLFEESVVKREDLFISSKLWSGNHAPEDVPEGIDTTLEDLQLDYLDLFLIHAPVRTEKGAVRTAENYIPLDVPATWGAMEKLYDSGKARAIGVSNFSCKRMEDLLAIAKAYSPLGRPGSPAFKGPSFLSNPIVISVAEKLQKTPA